MAERKRRTHCLCCAHAAEFTIKLTFDTNFDSLARSIRSGSIRGPLGPAGRPAAACYKPNRVVWDKVFFFFFHWHRRVGITEKKCTCAVVVGVRRRHCFTGTVVQLFLPTHGKWVHAELIKDFKPQRRSLLLSGQAGGVVTAGRITRCAWIYSLELKIREYKWALRIISARLGLGKKLVLACFRHDAGLFGGVSYGTINAEAPLPAVDGVKKFLEFAHNGEKSALRWMWR